MDNITFSDIRSLKLLSSFLSSKEEDLIKYLDCKDKIFDSRVQKRDLLNEDGIISIGLPNKSKYWFDKMYIPKKKDSSVYRIVYKVTDEALKNILKNIQSKLNAIYTPLDCVHGFVSGRNVATNAKIHLCKKEVLKLDIKDFFPSIKKNDVVNCFIKLGCTSDIAEYLATLITLNGELVQGFNTSPVIANMILQEMDLNILNLCKSFNADYSRYADDLYISSNTKLPPIDKIKMIVFQSGFIVNDNKTKIMKRGQKQYVTGLTVFENDSPRVPRKFKNRIRFSLYYLNKYGVDSCYNFTSEHGYLISHEKLLKGCIDYVNAVEPKLAKKFYEYFDNIEWYD